MTLKSGGAGAANHKVQHHRRHRTLLVDVDLTLVHLIFADGKHSYFNQ